jgi:hypothetical protein
MIMSDHDVVMTAVQFRDDKEGFDRLYAQLDSHLNANMV